MAKHTATHSEDLTPAPVVSDAQISRPAEATNVPPPSAPPPVPATVETETATVKAMREWPINHMPDPPMQFVPSKREAQVRGPDRSWRVVDYDAAMAAMEGKRSEELYAVAAKLWEGGKAAGA